MRLTTLKALALGCLLTATGSFCTALTLAESGYFQTTENDVSSPSRPQRLPCRVVKLSDGDTFWCDINQDGIIQKPIEKIRMIGIDTPELANTPKNQRPEAQPFAEEAYQFLKETIFDKVVYLELDRDATDRYGRTLAYVYQTPEEGLSVNEQLLDKGLAKPLFMGRNRRYEPQFRAISLQAEVSQVGLFQRQANGAERPVSNTP